MQAANGTQVVKGGDTNSFEKANLPFRFPIKLSKVRVCIDVDIDCLVRHSTWRRTLTYSPPNTKVALLQSSRKVMAHTTVARIRVDVTRFMAAASRWPSRVFANHQYVAEGTFYT